MIGCSLKSWILIVELKNNNKYKQNIINWGLKEHMGEKSDSSVRVYKHIIMELKKNIKEIHYQD